MTTKVTEKPAQKIGHSKEQSVGKKPTTAPKAETPATEPAPAAAEEAKAPEAPPAEAPSAPRPVSEFAPKTDKPKSKQSQKDFVHAHIGPERLKEIQKLQDTTNHSRTELIQQAWDHFVARPEVAKYLD